MAMAWMRNERGLPVDLQCRGHVSARGDGALHLGIVERGQGRGANFKARRIIAARFRWESDAIHQVDSEVDRAFVHAAM